MKFAKIFDLENDQQVLVVKDYDSDTDMDMIRVSTDFGSAIALVNYSFKNQEAQNEMFEAFDINSAIKFRNALEDDFK